MQHGKKKGPKFNRNVKIIDWVSVVFPNNPMHYLQREANMQKDIPKAAKKA